jgi:hypothetical protein
MNETLSDFYNASYDALINLAEAFENINDKKLGSKLKKIGNDLRKVATIVDEKDVVLLKAK